MRDAMHGFVERLLLRSPLTQEEREAILSLPYRKRTVERNRDLRLFGRSRGVSSVTAVGALARFSQTRDGRRQFIALHLPSDMADLCAILVPDGAFGLQTLTETVLHEVDHAHLLAVARRHRGIADAFWRDFIADSSLIAQQFFRISGLDARSRLANLLCEVSIRLGASAETPAREFNFPLTKIHLGEMLGLTSIHVNRMARLLREQQLAVMTMGAVVILDWPGLVHAAEFDPAFLQLERAVEFESARASACSG